ncbi:MAG: Manganese transport system membrane protein MntB [Chlamydiia bacterium]|nr:Manganese transport system membrane protein MntB [Chlamydiia bacterium]
MALLAGLLASIAGGVIGSYVVAKRIVFIGGSIAHSVLGGMGLFLFLRRTYNFTFLSPLMGALVFAIICAFIFGWVRMKFRQREDSIIAAIWVSGMAIGVIFIALTPGQNVELTNFLFGNILWTSSKDIYLLIALNLFVVITTLVCHRQFLAITFDEDQAYLQKIPVQRYYFLLLVLVGVTVVLLIQVIGAILVIAMLSLPAATANLYVRKLSGMIFLAVIISWIYTLLGTYLSFTLNWPPGATIALVATAGYLLSLIGANKKPAKEKTSRGQLNGVQ